MPLSGNQSRSSEIPNVLYGAIMGQSNEPRPDRRWPARAKFSYQQLEWAAEHYLREETLTDASACLVDYHHGLALSDAWGSGRLSSSDGQRFASRTRGPGTAALPRYFGHRRRGLQIYSWTADQYSQYASRVVAATVRDATHTLDGILDNQTVLPIEEHTTDTHGYTEMDTLRNLRPSWACGSRPGSAISIASASTDTAPSYRPTSTSSSSTSSGRSSSRPTGTSCCASPHPCVTAGRRRRCCSRAACRPAAVATHSPRALQEVRAVDQDELRARLARRRGGSRRQVGRQLNKGEQLHALRRFLFYANEGHVRHRTPEQQTGQALCLSVVVNAIIAWNTVYTQRILDQLRADRQLITTSEIEQISPLPHQHINAYGHHTFNLASRPTGYRPLGTPRQVAPPAAGTLNRV